MVLVPTQEDIDAQNKRVRQFMLAQHAKTKLLRIQTTDQFELERLQTRLQNVKQVLTTVDHYVSCFDIHTMPGDVETDSMATMRNDAYAVVQMALHKYIRSQPDLDDGTFTKPWEI